MEYTVRFYFNLSDDILYEFMCLTVNYYMILEMENVRW